MMVIETLFTIIVTGETGRWRGSERRLVLLPSHKNLYDANASWHFFGSRLDCIRNQRPIGPAAQTSTAIPIAIRYMANGANPRLRTQAMNQATAP
jgi:hypothetical protein